MTDLILPPGRVLGCNPRKSRFGDCCKPLADEMEVISRDQWASLLGNVGLRNKVKQIIDQGNYGSCATCSTSQAVMIAREVSGQPFVFLNPLSIYRVTSGGRDNGSSIDENLEFARDTGILPESYWPYSKGFKASPPIGWEDVAAGYRIDEFFDIANEEQVGTALLMAMPVVFGWQGHSCVLTRLLSTTTAEYANSWGDWGDNGFGTIKLSAINFDYGAFCVRTTVSDGGTVVPEVST